MIHFKEAVNQDVTEGESSNKVRAEEYHYQQQQRPVDPMEKIRNEQARNQIGCRL
ncbi:MAG: hypothetical protein ACPG05_04465 [Bdellovibrionales bacterium]